jgi:hypothetical protein
VRRVVAAAAVLALALPAGAVAASEKFGGETDQDLAVAFTLSRHTVKQFRANIRCTGDEVQKFRFPSMPVNRRGRFSEHQAGPSIDARIRCSRASGTLILPGCDADANEVRFSAHS